jgi:hypothetical protein
MGARPIRSHRACNPAAAAVLAWVFAGFASVAAPQPSEPILSDSDQVRPVRGRLLVQPRAGLTLGELDRILGSHGARRLGFIPQINVHIVELPPQADERAWAQMLQDNPHIEFAEVDRRVPPPVDRGDAAPYGHACETRGTECGELP